MKYIVVFIYLTMVVAGKYTGALNVSPFEDMILFAMTVIIAIMALK